MAGAARGSSPAPRTVGRYLVYGEIASGGMATVHFGRLTGVAGFARSVAIKRLHSHYARDPDFVKMFLDEARLAARIAHPNVVSTLDVVATDDDLFLVMDYVRGASLAQLARILRQRNERIPPRIAAAVIAGVLHGLHAAHEAKSETGKRLDIVHRDVSPQNVLVGTDGVARVLDFGVAKAAGRMQTTRDGQLKGKLSYMAPEQLQGGTVTRRTDVYASSVVLWETLTGQRLFTGENEGTILTRVLEGRAAPPSEVVPGLPPELDRVVLRGLQRDPSERYATAREMAQEIDASIGVAPAAEIGDWVEHVAARELEERAHRIAEIEGGVALDEEETSIVPSSPAKGAPDAPTPVGKREVEPKTERRASTLETETASQVSSVSLSQSALPPPPVKRRRGVWIALMTGCVAIGIGAAVALESRRGGEEPSGAAAASDSNATARPSAAAATTSGTATVEIPVESLPSASASAAPTPPGSAPTRPSVPATPRAPPVHRAAEPDCTPPYTTDANGHVHFKPQCL